MWIFLLQNIITIDNESNVRRAHLYILNGEKSNRNKRKNVLKKNERIELRKK